MEIWRNIDGYEGLYQVSNLGRVQNIKTGKILKPRVNDLGYVYVNLTDYFGKRKSCKVHRLVAQAYVANPYDLSDVHHINEDRTDNRVVVNERGIIVDSNIDWCSNYQNNLAKTEKSKTPKVVLQYTLDNAFVKEWVSTREIERELGFDHRGISACCNAHTKKAYGFIWKYQK